MTMYVDSSVMLSNYLGEDRADRAAEILASDPVLATSWLTVVEVRRTLSRVHGGATPPTVVSRVADDFDALALIGADASHAWYEVLIPNRGWVGFDPTNNKLAGNQHIITARGRDYADVPPLQGVFFGNVGEQSMLVSVDVCKIEPSLTTKSS